MTHRDQVNKPTDRVATGEEKSQSSENNAELELTKVEPMETSEEEDVVAGSLFYTHLSHLFRFKVNNIVATAPAPLNWLPPIPSLIYIKFFLDPRRY